jgi:hypothetical protein
MGSQESRSHRTETTPTNESYNLATWGPSPRGKVWVARESRSGSDDVGHLSVLLDMSGHSQYVSSDSTIPTVFSGVQVHLGLKEVKPRRFTRQAQAIFTQWPRMDKGLIKEEFNVGMSNQFTLITFEKRSL